MNHPFFRCTIMRLSKCAYVCKIYAMRMRSVADREVAKYRKLDLYTIIIPAPNVVIVRYSNFSAI